MLTHDHYIELRRELLKLKMQSPFWEFKINAPPKIIAKASAYTFTFETSYASVFSLTLSQLAGRFRWSHRYEEADNVRKQTEGFLRWLMICIPSDRLEWAISRNSVRATAGLLFYKTAEPAQPSLPPADRKPETAAEVASYRLSMQHAFLTLNMLHKAVTTNQLKYFTQFA